MSAPTYLRRRKLGSLTFEAIRYDHRYPKPTKRPRRTVLQLHLIWDRRS